MRGFRRTSQRETWSPTRNRLQPDQICRNPVKLQWNSIGKLTRSEIWDLQSSSDSIWTRKPQKSEKCEREETQLKLKGENEVSRSCVLGVCCGWSGIGAIRLYSRVGIGLPDRPVQESRKTRTEWPMLRCIGRTRWVDWWWSISFRKRSSCFRAPRICMKSKPSIL